MRSHAFSSSDDDNGRDETLVKHDRGYGHEDDDTSRDDGGYDSDDGYSSYGNYVALDDSDNSDDLDDSDDFDDFGDDDEWPARGRRSRRRSPDGFGAGFGDGGGTGGRGSAVRRGRLTDLERDRLAALREESEDGLDVPDGADRWSTWGQGELGPEPLPDWVITEEGAVDILRGVLKTGKEAEVHLVSRSLPGTDRSVLLAEKRYRSADHRLFHRDAGYLEGRRTRESRMERAISRRTTYGRKIIAEQWAAAEFTALSNLWAVGAPVPYPVQRVGTDLLLEFIGSDDGVAAPRLAQMRCSAAEATELWDQLCSALAALAQAGLTHGDLSAYNILVDAGRLVLIDLPQVVDVVANPQGQDFLRRDVENIAGWFGANGLSDAAARGEDLLALLCWEARITPSTTI